MIKNIFLFAFIFIALVVSYLARADFVSPTACQCQMGLKDYDPGKGYFFDRVTRQGFHSTVSAHFACGYLCADGAGKLWNVSYILDESYKGGSVGGPENAQRFICDYSISQFIPHTDPMTGKIMYYDTIPYGDFDPKQTNHVELKNWASDHCP